MFRFNVDGVFKDRKWRFRSSSRVYTYSPFYKTDIQFTIALDFGFKGIIKILFCERVKREKKIPMASRQVTTERLKREVFTLYVI